MIDFKSNNSMREWAQAHTKTYSPRPSREIMRAARHLALIAWMMGLAMGIILGTVTMVWLAPCPACYSQADPIAALIRGTL